MAEEQPPSPQWWILPLVQVLALNAVPLYGVFWAGWSWSTIVVLYWFENVLGGLAIALRMVIHRKLTRKRGYLRPHLGLTIESNGRSRKFKSFLAEFMMASLGFSLVHGVFLTFLIGEAEESGAEIQIVQLQRGVLILAVLLIGSLAVDFQGIRNRPFLWIREMAESALRRTIVIHLTLLFGLFGAKVLGASRCVFALFALLKLLADLGVILQRKNRLMTRDRKREKEEQEDEKETPFGPPVVPKVP